VSALAYRHLLTGFTGQDSQPLALLLTLAYRCPPDGPNRSQPQLGIGLLDNPSILIDGTQLLQRRGTGIASYTRTVARCLHSLGARVNLLFGTNSHPKKGDPDFALANQVFLS
jgi:hypothetical protein